jgi:hypothetical protein
MPATGINFNPIKSRKAAFSSNPRSVATAKWEKALEGLTLSKHRADKAAATARSRVRSKAKNAPGWGALAKDEQEARLNVEFEKIAKVCLEKKAALDKAWKDEHGVKGSESMMDIDAEEVASQDDAMESEWENFKDKEEKGSDEEDEVEENEEISEEAIDEMAEEDSEPDTTGPFTEADKESIFQQMEIVSKNQEKRAARLLADWERNAKDGSSEMPADWSFGK